MSDTRCGAPLPPDTLLAYWLGELDEAATAAADEHLLGCDHCGAALDALAALGDGVRRAFVAGRVGVAIGPGFARRLAEHGLRLREYRVAPQGQVNCHVDPADDLVLSRLSAPLAGLTRLDLVVHPADGGPPQRAEDIPFDAEHGEVVLVAHTQRLRALPSGTERVELLAVDTAGERRVGDYRFNHRSAAG